MYTVFMLKLNDPLSKWGPLSYNKHVVINKNSLPFYLYVVEALGLFNYFINKDLTIEQNYVNIHMFNYSIFVKSGAISDSVEKIKSTNNQNFFNMFNTLNTICSLPVISRTVPVGKKLTHHKKLSKVKFRFEIQDEFWKHVEDEMFLYNKTGIPELLDRLEATRKPLTIDEP